MSCVFSRSGSATRFIPEMRFVCNTTIAGYTVAMRKQNRGQQPMIQIWREAKIQQTCAYDRIGLGIPIDEAACVDGLTEVASGVFDCDLTEGHRVSVQPGDILGLKQPANADTSEILFANVTRGPINYVFEQQLLSSTVMLSNHSSVNQELPQITFRLEVESGNILFSFLYLALSSVRVLMDSKMLYR